MPTEQEIADDRYANDPDYRARVDAQKAKDAEGMGGAGGGDGPLVGPEDLSGQFPGAALIGPYKRIKPNRFTIPGAGYDFVDPLKFGEAFGKFNRTQMESNFEQAQKFGMDAVESELQSLMSYAPRAGALKRSEIGIDNQFNQAQRTAQINSTLPDVVGDLNLVASNARAYAAGRLPDSISDRGLELGLRSGAADASAVGGFGATSRFSGKLSDLISSDKRFQISQYGNQLLGQSAAQRAELLLAPTEYSNAGSEISVKPTLSGSQLTSSYFSDINNQTLLSPQTAFTSAIQQSQFFTTLQQGTQQFNANMRSDLVKFNRQMRFNTNSFNANAKNNFALSYFNYLNKFADSVASTKNANTNLAIEQGQQQQATDIYNSSKDTTQGNNTAGSLASGITSILGGVDAGAKGIAGLYETGKDIFNTVSGWFS